jgi:glycosyltransferase involved in cell wall biosynthesis
MSRREPLKVAIDAQIEPGISGGVAQAAVALIEGLGRLHDGSETYTIVVGSEQQSHWLRPVVGPNQQLVIKRRLLEHVKPSLGPLLTPARYFRDLFRVTSPEWLQIPLSHGVYEHLGCHVVHFYHQRYVKCRLPTVYNPHDLQHIHYPQFFTPPVMAWRKAVVSAGCLSAHTVVVGSQWVKDDIIRYQQVAPSKVQVIPEAPATQFCPEPSQEVLSMVKDKHQLEQPFALYPAVTWPHKNHIRLLEALAYLRDSAGLVIRLVCTGSLNEPCWREIEARVRELGLQHHVKFLGFVPQGDLRAVYRLSQLLVMPTLFEAISLPIFEAWLEGVPVACSSITSLPDQVMDAAVLFDPHDMESIARAVASVATNAELRRDLRRRGFDRLKDFDWERTSKAYRAVYRRAAGYALTEEDRWLLAWDWMRDPQRTMGTR